MNKGGIYIANTESWTGRSLVALGIMKLLHRQANKVGYFRPIISDLPEGQKDNHIETMISYFDLGIDYEDVIKKADANNIVIVGVTEDAQGNLHY